MDKIVRYLVCKDKIDGKNVYSIQLYEFKSDLAKQYFDLSNDPEMENSYKLDRYIFPFFKKYIPDSIMANFDFEKYEFNIEGYIEEIE
jgi:hypothetical protein